MKKIIFFGMWKYNTNAKLETSVSKTKGLEESTWIKNEEILKEASKYWKTFSTSTP
jgi:hypothetical protein